MTLPKDAFRLFQEELAALDSGKEVRAEVRVAETPGDAKLAKAKSEFLALRDRFELSVADVVAFFPERDGIEFLRHMIAASEAKPRRTKKQPAP
ncbi:MAG: 2-hydroxyacyl-CoA dehydratase [Rhodanobacter sp.]